MWNRVQGIEIYYDYVGAFTNFKAANLFFNSQGPGASAHPVQQRSGDQQHAEVERPFWGIPSSEAPGRIDATMRECGR